MTLFGQTNYWMIENRWISGTIKCVLEPRRLSFCVTSQSNLNKTFGLNLHSFPRLLDHMSSEIFNQEPSFQGNPTVDLHLRIYR